MSPLIIAHRGASGYLPEHTLEAKRLAHEMGADYLEQDVVATRDDALVVLHDVYLDRVSDVAARYPGRARDDGRYYVRDFDLAEVRQLRVWERMNADGTAVYPTRYPVQSGDFRIHTLSDELEFIAELNAASDGEVGIYPEIKRPAWHRENGVDIAPLMLSILAEHGYLERADRAWVQCFDASEIRRLRIDLGCSLKLVQLTGINEWRESDTDFESLLSEAGLREVAEVADAIGPWIQQLYVANVTPVANGIVEMAHEMGLSVHAYTFRSDDLPEGFGSFDDLLRFSVKEMKLDGLFTDFPDTARNILASLEN